MYSKVKYAFDFTLEKSSLMKAILISFFMNFALTFLQGVKF